MKNTSSSIEFNIYLSYPFNRDSKNNFYAVLSRYRDIGMEISAWFYDWEKMDGFPKINLYIPAEHEPFIHRAYMYKYLTVEDIAMVNNSIIADCDLLILFGRLLDTPPEDNIVSEMGYAKQNEIPVHIMPDLSSNSIESLKLTILHILKLKG